MLRYVLILSLLVQFPLASAAAQSGSVPVAGDVVRLRTDRGVWVFDVTEWAPPTVRLRNRGTGDHVTIPLDVMQRVEVRRGTVSRGKGMVSGMMIGALAGAMVGAIVGLAGGDDSTGMFSLTASEKAVLLGVTMGVGGCVIGGAVGYSKPRSRWEPVEQHVSLGSPR
jgi:hypothetical protein